jgi:hypothetical protein
MQSIEPGIQGFPDVQLHIWGLVLTHHPGMTKSVALLTMRKHQAAIAFSAVAADA